MPAKIPLSEETQKIETLLANATALRRSYPQARPAVEALYTRAVALATKQKASRTSNPRAYEAGATPRLAYLQELEALEAVYAAEAKEYAAWKVQQPQTANPVTTEIVSRAVTLRTLTRALSARKRTAESTALATVADDLARRVHQPGDERQRAQVEAQIGAVEAAYRQLIGQGGQLTPEQRSTLDQTVRAARAQAPSSGAGWLLGLGAAAGLLWAVTR